MLPAAPLCCPVRFVFPENKTIGVKAFKWFISKHNEFGGSCDAFGICGDSLANVRAHRNVISNPRTSRDPIFP